MMGKEMRNNNAKHRTAYGTGILTGAVLLACFLFPAQAAAQKVPTAPMVDLSVMIEFPASTFTMGVPLETPSAYGDAWFIDQTPAHDVELGAFYMDPYEVTTEQFALFLSYAAGEYHFYPDQPIERVAGGYLPLAGTQNEPMRYVTWEAAYHYCLWAGKRLPTEAQWERAAAGTEGRDYPWGSDEGPSCGKTVFFSGTSYCEESPLEVGSKPDGATPDGVFDMAGNVAEWVADFFQWNYYSESPSDNPTGPSEGTLRTVRGGGLFEGSVALRSRGRRSALPVARSANLGFRCAWSADPTDGALRGALSAPADAERELTDRPLAPPADTPEILADDLLAPNEIVYLQGAWYVLDETDAAIYEIVEGEDQSTVFADGFDTPVDLATDGQALYVADQGAETIVGIGVSGNKTTIASGQGGVSRILADSGEVFWFGDGGIMRRTVADGVQQIVDVIDVTDMALSDTYLFYTVEDGVDKGVSRILREGGTPEILVTDGVYTSFYPCGVTYDPDNAILYFMTKRSGWPSHVVLCSYPEKGAADYDCFAYSPPHARRPVVSNGCLYWITSHNIVRMNPATDATYEVVGTWANSNGLAASPDTIAWTDASNGRVYRKDL